MAAKHEVITTSTGSMIKKAPWTIISSTRPISNASEIAAMQDELDGLPLPEMPFGNNSLVIRNEDFGWEYSFTPLEALRLIRLGELLPGDGGVQVGHAKAWLQSRSSPSSTNPMPKVVQAKPFDWTYTTTYSGHISENRDGLHSEFSPGDPTNSSHRIPIEELSRPDPILFFAEVPLFESELDDNGSSSYTILSRVMPTSFFVLARFSLRVDGVLFRIFDTRLYHSFESSPPLIVRETSGWEAPYKTIKSFLPTPDLSPLTDPSFVYRAITSLPKSKTQDPAWEGGTGWRGLGTRVEVLELTVPPSYVSNT